MSWTLLGHHFCTTLWNSLCCLIAPSLAWQERFGGKVLWKRWRFISRSALISSKFSANQFWHLLLWTPKVLRATESTLTLKCVGLFIGSWTCTVHNPLFEQGAESSMPHKVRQSVHTKLSGHVSDFPVLDGLLPQWLMSPHLPLN